MASFMLYGLRPRFAACLRFRAHNRCFSNLAFSDKVKNALNNGLPVVCLESTIITHGMEYPANLRMARAVEKVIIDNGATPATIAILNGKPHIGLEDADLELLARTGRQARKISRRDMAACIADTATGGTTVSGTMILAKMAGIKVFVTGGIGGVHREAELTMDISNDLNELSKNDVAVVCAGPKAILDIPLTLEYLETMGVTVTTIGQENLPAFYSRDSGIPSPQSSPSAEHAARLIDANQKLQLGSAVLVCVPIPAAASIDMQEMRLVIDSALDKAKESGIKGKDTTPFLLGAVAQATKGRSLEANISLVLENARVGAAIAVRLQALQSTSQDSPAIRQPSSTAKSGLDIQESHDVASALADLEAGISLQNPSMSEASNLTSSSGFENIEQSSDVLVIGGTAVDLTCHINASVDDYKSVLFSSVPGTFERSLGGVGGNLARAVAATGTTVTLASIIGGQEVTSLTESRKSSAPDADGQYILDGLRDAGLAVKLATIPGARSATYTAIQARGELLLAVADMEISTTGLPALESMKLSKNYQAILFDANIPDIVGMIERRGLAAPLVCFEPTSVAKAPACFGVPLNSANDAREVPKMWPDNVITTTTPNIHELSALFDAARSIGCFEDDRWWEIINALDISSIFRSKVDQFLRKHKQIALPLSELGVIQQAIHLLPFFENIYLTMGSSGVLSFHLSATTNSSLQKAGHAIIQDGLDCHLYIIYHPPVQVTQPVISDTGAGDTFTGVLISSLVKDTSVIDSVNLAQKAAVLTLASGQSVAPNIAQLFKSG